MLARLASGSDAGREKVRVIRMKVNLPGSKISINPFHLLRLRKCAGFLMLSSKNKTLVCVKTLH